MNGQPVICRPLANLRINRTSDLPSSKSGAVLIIALGVLTLMAILGAAFAQLMRLEKRAAENYVDARRMDYLLDTALNRVMATLHGGKNFRSYSSYKDTPWLYVLPREDDLGHGRVNMEDPRVGMWENFHRGGGREEWHKTKVIDCASQINLNGEQDTLARMLDHLAEAIDRADRLKRDGRPISNPLYTRANRTGTKIRGEDIVRIRRRLPGGEFTSKSQLKQIIGEENFEIIKDFVTCYGYLDPFTYRASDGLTEVPEILGSGGGAGGGGTASERQPPAYGVRIDPEPRYPININTAPKEVLVAAIWGLAGRRVFPYSNLELQGVGGSASMEPVDSAAGILGQRVVAQEEVGNLLPRAIFVYSPRFEYEHAQKIADRIDSQRKLNPFIAWRTNDRGKPGFEDFVDILEESFFPPPTNVLAIDPDQPANQQIARMLRAGGTSPVSRMWQKGHGQGASRAVRQQFSKSFHTQNAWYYDLIKGVLKANFNPNTRINRYNPNEPSWVPVDKSDLVWAKDQFNLFKGHSTDFCFDSMGYYEVTTLGLIGLGEGTPKGRTAVSDSRRAGRRGPNPLAAFERPFTRKVRTIVKVFDILRHTNQFHFEKTFTTGNRSSDGNRRFVATWPNPMEALTHLYSGGSRRDGRVELAGLLDGRRMEAPLSSREQMYRASGASVRLAHGFQDRDQQSLSRLRRALVGGVQSIAGDEVSARLKDVLNANYAAQGQQLDQYYRKSWMTNLSVVRNQSAHYNDPRVNRESMGTDLFPDGFHSGLLTTPHVGSRALLLPAMMRIDRGREESKTVKVGAAGIGMRGVNSTGNVPYYRGGLAFFMKFAFDGDDPVFSGLLGCTQVITEVKQNAADPTGSEGTQFYVFKNSRGELRVVRMYYHQAVPQGGAGGGSGATFQLFPQSTSPDEGGVANKEDPILENLDQQKLISRSDIAFSVRHFKAHEWHHIAIEWDDGNTQQPIRLWLDFEPVPEATARMPQALIDGTANSWVRLNVRQPRDGLEVGGIVREQADARFGIFKWFSNSTSTGRGGGIQRVAPEVKRLMANATIDELTVFEGRFQSVERYYGHPHRGYFTNQTGEYANLFEIPMPAEVDYITLRSLNWTSYYPTIYTAAETNSPVQALRSEPIECQVTYLPAVGGTEPPRFSEPWRTQLPTSRIANRKVARRRTGLQGKSAEVVYTFNIKAGQPRSGSITGASVQSPAIDDVTLTYFLPNPRILLQEEAD